jgi:hypothetical protein
MIGLVLVTHGRLAEEMRLAMEHVVGPQSAVETVCIGPDDELEGARAHIRDAVCHVDRGDGVAVLTDMFGGTPANLAASMQEVCPATPSRWWRASPSPSSSSSRAFAAPNPSRKRWTAPSPRAVATWPRRPN